MAKKSRIGFQPVKSTEEQPQAGSLCHPIGYAELLDSLKERVRQSQTKAMLSVSRELIQLYWDIGRQIAQRQNFDGWGRSTVERLAANLQNAFSGIQGFSRTNIFRMRAFFQAYSHSEVVPQPVGQLNAEVVLAQPAREIAVDRICSELTLCILTNEIGVQS